MSDERGASDCTISIQSFDGLMQRMLLDATLLLITLHSTQHYELVLVDSCHPMTLIVNFPGPLNLVFFAIMLTQSLRSANAN